MLLTLPIRCSATLTSPDFTTVELGLESGRQDGDVLVNVVENPFGRCLSKEKEDKVRKAKTPLICLFKFFKVLI